MPKNRTTKTSVAMTQKATKEKEIDIITDAFKRIEAESGRRIRSCSAQIHGSGKNTYLGWLTFDFESPSSVPKEFAGSCPVAVESNEKR
jgi:hypothetical protein